jgi:hypothetical protein
LVLYDGTAGQRLALKIVPGPISDVWMYRPNQAVLASGSTGIFTTLLEPPLLPVTGTYQFMIDPIGSNTGTHSLTLYDVPPDISGTITPGGSAVTVSTSVPGQNAKHTFTGAVNDRVALLVSGGPGGSVSVLKPDGSTLTSASIGIFSSFLDTFLLPVAGTYSLFTNYDQANTGNVTLTLYSVPADVSGTITAGGSSVNVPITTPGQNGALTFSATAGDRVSLQVSSGPSGTVYLLRPDGSQQAFVYSGFFSTLMEPQTLATTGTYTIKVDPDGASTGTLSLTLYNVPADVSGTITPGGSSVGVTITTPGQNGVLTFSGTSGQRVSLHVTSGPSGTIYLLRPDGSQQTFVYSGWLQAFMEPQTLATTGTYSIKVDLEGASTGSLTLSLYSVPADTTGTVSIGGSAVGVSLGSPGQNGTLTFSGTNGQDVTVHLTSNTMGTPVIRLLKPDGSQLTWGFSGSSSFDLPTQTLPTTGTYTIVIDPDGAATGSINVSVSTP